MRFKDFLNEKKKVVEPSWIDDYTSGYAALRDMQNNMTKNASNYNLQLFVPKHRDPKKMDQLKRDRDWWQIKKEIPDEPIKEDTTPVLTGYKESPPGDNKPAGAFWTSSAIKKGDKYTSDWYQFVQDVFPDWQTDYGFLFEVKPTALVFDSHHLEHFYEWVEFADKFTKPMPDYAKSYGRDIAMRSHFPWDVMGRYFDGVFHYGGRGYGDEFTYGWDVESTAWFNTRDLVYKGAVKLAHRYEDDDE